MTFDMSQCKIGDKLKTRGGYMVEYTSYDSTNHPYCWWVDDKISIDKCGYRYSAESMCHNDIIGFWEEEEKPLSEDDEYFPNIEVRTPHVAKITTYRVHFNEMFHRDLSEEEAVAIYQQLKTLLGEK